MQALRDAEGKIYREDSGATLNKDQIQVLEITGIITQIKNLMKGLNIRLENLKEKLSKLNDILEDIPPNERR